MHKKGISHFTVMLIPHSEKKIFSFQISNYILAFVAGLIFFSLLSIYHYYSIRQGLMKDLQEVIEADKSYWEKHKKISKGLEENKNYSKKLRNEFRSIYNIIGKNETSSLWQKKNVLEIFDLKDREISQKFQIEHKVPIPLKSLLAMGIEIENTKMRFHEIDSLLKARESLLKHIPTQWPVYGDKGYKTSEYGKRFSPFENKYKFHTGVDIAALPRTPIVASADGFVSFSGTKSGYGYVIILKHKYGYKTVYGHNAKNLVRIGQKVKKGQKIAWLGRTGRATGYHVHFEVRINGIAVDPWPYIMAAL